MCWLTDTRKLHHKAHVLQVLKSTAVRGYANTLAYYNQEYATKDAMNIGRLHTYLSGGSRLARQPCLASALHLLVDTLTNRTVWCCVHF